MSDRIKSLLVYAAKCGAGSLLVYTIAKLFHYTDIGWCLISVMLVLSPEAGDSVSLAVTRIKANLVGACVGVVCLCFSPPNMWSVSIALMFTVAFCSLFKIDVGVRSALAATIIIMLHGGGRHVWDSAIERVIAILTGCILGLIVTFVFHFKWGTGVKSADDQHEA